MNFALFRARGRALTLLALAQANISRTGIVERLPLLGDYVFRRHLFAALDAQRWPGSARAREAELAASDDAVNAAAEMRFDDRAREKLD